MALGLLTTAVFTPLLAGLLCLLLPRPWVTLRVLLAACAPAVTLVALALFAARFGVDSTVAGIAWMPDLKLDLQFHADRLGLFFAFLVAGIGLLIVLYARGYFGPDAASLFRFYPSLLLFMTAMLGLVLSDSFMLLLLFWELTSISSFLLIGWERDDPSAVKKALQAFVVTGAGGLALMGGLILLGVHTVTWSFSEMNQRALTADTLTAAAFVLIFCGAAAKSAQWPLHFWLPGAMAAPTPVSAYLHSATMVKAGVYLMGRLWPMMAAALPLWPKLLVPIGALTMVLGAYIALRKTDLKQIFAYTTVSQLGLLICAYGLSAFRFDNQPNLIWDVTQILNHALYKAPLFLIAGAIAHVVHTRELPELRGLFWLSGSGRIMAGILLLAAYAMAAFPLTLGFAAKEFFLYGIYHAYEATHHPAFYALMAAAVLASACNVAIFIRIARVVLGKRPENSLHATHHDHHDEDVDEDLHETGFWPAMLWVPALGLVLLQYLGGIWPGGFERLFGGIESTRGYFEHIPSLPYLLTHPGVPLALSAAAIALGILIGFSPIFTRTIQDVHDRLFPAFYDLATKGGGWAFNLVQTGNLRTYFAIIIVAMVLLVVGASGWFNPETRATLVWPEGAKLEPFEDLLPGYLLTFLVCLSAILMPLVRERASRVLVLGTAGFAVTAVYYLYQAPDLALTQISIEIVSLILFLLVLSLLPKTTAHRAKRKTLRLAIALSVGAMMFWLSLSSATAERPEMPYLNRDGQRFAHLGEFFLRNSYKSVDVEHHIGGGGNNVVNVILVDFRGFDTLGEITVLGLAAMGVWTLLRRRHRRKETRAVQRNLSEPSLLAEPPGAPQSPELRSILHGPQEGGAS